MSEFINTVDVIGDDALTDSIIDKSIIEYKDNKITTLSDYAFISCGQLTSVNFPSVKQISGSAFSNCSQLTTADFSSVTNMGGEYIFSHCTSLTALLLRSTALCKLYKTNSFNNTPITSGVGYIYVPRALLSDDDSTKDYRRATNWSNFTTFRALEDYTVDGTITGELDPTKI